MNVLRLVLALATLGLFAAAGQGWSRRFGGEAPEEELIGAVSQGLIDSGAGIGLLLLGAWLLGRIAGAAKLPQIVGFLAFGVVCGPHALGIINKEELTYLALVNDLAIALIALTAGGEIRLDFLRRSLKAVTAITVVEMAVVCAGVGVFAALVIRPMGLLGDAPGALELGALALVLGTVCITNSPAVLLAVITEVRARGEMARLGLSVTVLKDLLLVILFTLVISLATGPLTSSGDRVDASDGATAALVVDGAAAPDGPVADPAPPAWVKPAKKIGGSIAAGVAVGLVMAVYVARVGAHLPIFVIFSCFGIALISERLGLETLIVAVVAGMLVENVWGERVGDLFETIEDLSTPVFCVFFGVAGAKIDLDGVAQMWPWALAFIGVRGVMVWLGTEVGARLAGVEPRVRRWLWTALLPQAGITLALATILEQTFRGEPFIEPVYTLLLAMIAIQKVVAPVLLKTGLTRTDAAAAAAYEGGEPPESGPP